MKSDENKPEDVSREMKSVVGRLSQEAERLKKLCEVQALKGNTVELSVDKSDLMQDARAIAESGTSIGDVRDMMNLLRLFSQQ
jgi:hypothetical protein